MSRTRKQNLLRLNHYLSVELIIQMTRQQIQEELFTRHQSFVDRTASLSEAEFTVSTQNKWTAGQQLDHICRATAPVLLALKMPKLILKVLFGKPKRVSRNYDDLVKKYHSVLQNGGKASGFFIPKQVAFSQREQLQGKLFKTISGLSRALQKFTEADLDNILLPHPLLGKLTIREMLYFTLYHANHHKEQINPIETQVYDKKSASDS